MASHDASTAAPRSDQLPVPEPTIDQLLDKWAPTDRDVVIDADGRLWAVKCRCGLHPNRGHDARPLQPEAVR